MSVTVSGSSSSSSLARRLVAGLLLPLAVVAGAVLPWVLRWEDLPDPVATHWSTGAPPDGHMPPLAAALSLIVPAVAAALVVAAVGWRGRVGPGGPTMAATVAGGFGGLFVVLAVAVTGANAGAASWHDATLRPWLVVVGVVVAMIAGGAAVAAALGALPGRPAPPPGTGRGPVAGRGPGDERLAWAGSCHVRWPLALAAAFGVAAAAAVLVALWLAAMLALITLVVASLATVYVTVGAAGVRATAALGWPGVTIPLAEITAGRAIDLRPRSWGGWGYRGSLRLAGRAAWVLRRGEALELTLTGDRRFAVTVDDAATAAEVLATYVVAPTGPAG